MGKIGSVEHPPAVTPLVEQTRPWSFAVALALVWIGVWVGALDVVATTVGLFTMTWVWRDHIDDYHLVLLLTVVPAVVGAVAAIGTLFLLRRARGRSRSGRIGLAVLMFCFIPATDADTLFRGIVEGVAMTYARVADELHPAAPRVVEVAAAGRVSNDQPEWLQILADVLARPVTHVTRRRTTQRGTALLALEMLAPDTPRAPRATGTTYEPQTAHAEHHTGRRARFAELYDALVRG